MSETEELKEPKKPEYVIEWEEYVAARPPGMWLTYMGIRMCVIRGGGARIINGASWGEIMWKYWHTDPILCEFVDGHGHFITKEFGIEMLSNNIPLEPQ